MPEVSLGTETYMMTEMRDHPTVWVLLGAKAGGNGQLLSLAEALGWRYEAKRMVYNWQNRCPNVLLRSSLTSLDRKRSSPLVAPWPDVVIAASRRSVPIARWIKKQSGGRARLVHLLHAQAPLDWFDLVITTPQYRLPRRPNVLHLTAALNRPSPDRLAEAAERWQAHLRDLPRPYTALLVGGNSSTYELDADTAARLGRESSVQVEAAGGSLLVSTSPRTPEGAADALLARIGCPAYCYRWRPNDPDNPYLAFLALADRFIVTVDSASQVVEACIMQKPVSVFGWPARSSRRVSGTLRRWLESHKNPQGQPTGPGTRLSRFYDRMLYMGLIKPTRDFDAYLQALRARGLISWFGEPDASVVGERLDDLEQAVAHIRRLFPTFGSTERAARREGAAGSRALCSI